MKLLNMPVLVRYLPKHCITTTSKHAFKPIITNGSAIKTRMLVNFLSQKLPGRSPV